MFSQQTDSLDAGSTILEARQWSEVSNKTD